MEAIVDINIIKGHNSEFEAAYIRLRQSENRLFSDVEVLQLPYVPKQHLHFKEWKIRKQSANKLFKYLKSLDGPLTILEVGCGNGWLSAYLANMPLTKITGVDVNLQELNQAKKLFANKENLQFVEGSVENLAPEKKYDIILFAASIQYFSNLQNIINQSLQHLNNSGEIHIIDTLFYHSDEIVQAKKRSSDYFNNIGHYEMIDFYYHHKLEDLLLFNTSILKDPTSIFNHLWLKDPFYWIRIKV